MIGILGEIRGTGRDVPGFLHENGVIADPRFPNRDHQILPDRGEAHVDAVLPGLPEHHSLVLFQSHAFLNRLTFDHRDLHLAGFVTLQH